MADILAMGKNARLASRKLAGLGTTKKNDVLCAVADAVKDNSEYILGENLKDVEQGRADGMKSGLLDRLTLTKARIDGMADGIRQVAALDDPIGEVLSMKKRPNGLLIGRKRVPFGVIAVIYESRPNVTLDTFGLCFKAGNAVILKGGSDAINSNIAIASVIRKALRECGIDENAIQLIDSTDRECVKELLTMNEYVDVVIPRGGKGLIQFVVKNSTVPVIETGTGNCHVFVDESADFDMAINIIENAKTQRVGVCNACESLVVHKNIAGEFIPKLVHMLKEHNVEIRGDEFSCLIDPYIVPATEEDYATEYLDYIISLKTVDSLDEAIEHINSNNTGHSESIVTNNYENSQRFLDEIDAACVYVNASTRFTDGNEFGFGAEIGISTQKLHARGPMGINELTTTKYIIYGDGQIRK
ncbi:gamma-glutamyl phosphate reductase [Firmicutes bacterium CAG:882]|nr:gamma-glutamyl phosphate reductase [Firmicutes bacterium CAG:882]